MYIVARGSGMGQTRGTGSETESSGPWVSRGHRSVFQTPLLLVGWTTVQFISPLDITQDKRGKEIDCERLRDMHQVGQCWEEASNGIGWVGLVACGTLLLR